MLSHQMENGTQQPIGFGSQTLAPAERKYAQVEKEALAIIFGVKKFHQYLLGRRFTILSDHKPLMYLFVNEVSEVYHHPWHQPEFYVGHSHSVHMSMQSGTDL